MALLTEENAVEYLPLLITDHSKQLQTVIDPDVLGKYCHLGGEQAKQTPPIQPPYSTMGALSQLPLELLHLVLSDLDIQSLYHFKAVNRLSSMTVDSLGQHKIIVEQAPNTLRAALSTGIARWISLRKLYDTLCSNACVQCGDFAAFIYLLSCSRVCYICLREKDAFLPLTLSHAKDKYGLNAASARTLPYVLTLPGTYSAPPLRQSRRVTLVDSSAAERAGTALHKSVAAMQEYVAEQHRIKTKAYEAKKQRRGPRGRHPPRPRYTSYVDRKCNNPHRYMGVVRSPWLDRRNGIAQWGFSCKSCRDCNFRQFDWKRMYTQTGYIEHFSSCIPSQQALELVLTQAEKP
jgi:hypothetical protein